LKRAERIIIVGSCLLIALFFPLWILQFLALIFLFCYFISYIYIYIFQNYVHISRDDSVLRIHRSQSVLITITVKNYSFLPVHSLLIQDYAGTLETPAIPQCLMDLNPWQQKKFTYEATGFKRGLFEVGPIQISFSDPFGFFRKRLKIKVPLNVIVYPKIYSLYLQHNRGLPSGNILVQKRVYEDTTRYRQLRDYVPGDDTRRINWKISAKQAKLICVDYLSTIYFPVIIYLNLTLSNYPRRYRYTFIERAIETAASLIEYFINLRQGVGLIATGVINPGSHTGDYITIPVHSGAGQALNLLEILAKIKPAEYPFNRVITGTKMNLPFGARFCIISPALPDDQLDFLAEIKKRSNEMEWYQINPARMPHNIQGQIKYHPVKDFGSEIL
jgi:uncharacterized protein (DUF58 family)